MTQKYQVKVSMKQAAIVETGIVLKQGDFGMQLEIEVLDFDVTGTTPQIVFRKAMGAVESTTITVSGNKYTYTFKGTELDTPGKVFCDLKLKNSTTQRISTASFMFRVIADTMDGLNEQASSYSDTIEQIVGGFDGDINELHTAIDDTRLSIRNNVVTDLQQYLPSEVRNGAVTVNWNSELLTITGTATTSIPTVLLTDEMNLFQKGKDYRIGGEVSGTTPNIQVLSINSQNQTTVLYNNNTLVKDPGTKFTIPDNSAKIVLRLSTIANTTYNSSTKLFIRNIIPEAKKDYYNRNEIDLQLNEGYTIFVSEWEPGRIYGANAQRSNTGDASYTRVMSTPLHPAAEGHAKIYTPTGYSASFWRFNTSSCTSGDGAQILPDANSKYTLSPDYWYLICLYATDDPTGHYHYLIPDDVLENVILSYTNRDRYYTRLINKRVKESNGFNILNFFDAEAKTEAGITYTPKTENKIHIEGTKTGNSIYYLWNDKKDFLLPGAIYYVNFKSFIDVSAQILYTLEGSSDYVVLVNTKECTNLKITIPNTIEKLRVRLICNANQANDDVTFTVTESPVNPIENTYNFNLINLFAPQTFSAGGITYTPIDKGQINIKGTKNSNSIYYISNARQNIIKANGIYYVSYDSNSSNCYVQVMYTLEGSADYNVLVNTYKCKNTKITLPAAFDKLYIRIICNASSYINKDVTLTISEYLTDTENSNYLSKYATEYTTAEDETVNKVVAKKNGNVLIFTVTTDAHWNDQNDYTRSLLDVSYVGARIAEEVGADFRADLGDVFTDLDDTTANARNMNAYITYCKNSFVPFVYSQGNHETFGGHYDEHGQPITALQQSQVAAIGLTGRNIEAVRNPSEPMGGYYYFDFPERNVRVYCLNSKNNAFSSASVTWVASTLANLPENYGVVFFSHIPPIPEALWEGHTTTTNAAELRAVMANFVTNGGKIFALLHGHMHWDNLFYVSDLNCPVIGIVSSVLDTSEITNPPEAGEATRPARAQDNVTRYAIENVCIDTTTGEINLIRFGAGSDRTYSPET